MALFQKSTREERFWKWFAEHSQQLFEFEADRDRVFAQLSRELSRVEKGLTFEFGPVTDARREFIISANGIRARFPAVQSLAAAAPSFPEWVIIPFRPPKDLTQFRSIRINAVSISLDDVWFSYELSDSRMNLEIFIRGLTAQNERELAGAGFLLLDLALGEYVVATRIGGIAWRPLPPAPEAEQLLPLAEIINVVTQPEQ